MVDESDLKIALENVKKLTPEKEASWAIPADFVPQSLKVAIQRLALKENEFLWEEPEKLVLKKILNSKKLMNSLFLHLEKFQLEESEWRAVIFDGIVGAYRQVLPEKEYEREKTEYYFQEVSRTAYYLRLLLTQWNDDLPYDSVLNQCEIESNISNELLKIVSASTSVHWPEQLYNLNRNSEASSEEYNAIETLIEKETNNLSYHSLSRPEDIKFPPPNIRYQNESIGKYRWTRFIETLLENLDIVSINSQRNFNIQIKKGLGEVPSKRSCIFFQPAHWQKLCELVFGIEIDGKDTLSAKDQYQLRTIRKVIHRHRSRSSEYPPQIQCELEV